jgi:hypothetical protein
MTTLEPTDIAVYYHFLDGYIGEGPGMTGFTSKDALDKYINIKDF